MVGMLVSFPGRVLAGGQGVPGLWEMIRGATFGALGLLGGGDALSLKENDSGVAGNQLCLPKQDQCLKIDQSFFETRGFPKVWGDLNSDSRISVNFDSNTDTCDKDSSDKHQEVAEAILIFAQDNNNKNNQDPITHFYLNNGCIKQLNFDVLLGPFNPWGLDLINNQIQSGSSLVNPENFKGDWIDLSGNPVCNSSEKTLCEDSNFQKLLNNGVRIYCAFDPLDCSEEAIGLAPSTS